MVFKKGNIPWNKYLPREQQPTFGKKMPISEETKKKLSKARMIGLSNGTIKPWHKGLKLTVEHRNKISKNHRRYQSKETINKIKKNSKNNPNFGMKGKEHSKETRIKLSKARLKQILPLKDTKIELKIQDFLTLLKVEFITHKYMNIKNSYQCDIFIPEQDRIPQKTIIECDGDFFHMNPNKFAPEDTAFKNGIKAKEKWKIDGDRTNQLIEKRFKVIRLWESEIKNMNIERFAEVLQ